MAVSHDRLFKELLTTFFWEFLELFVPALCEHLDRDSLVFLDKELFTDVTAGRTHEVDMVAHGRFRGGETCFLVHVETQAQCEADFAARMFRYFARLHERHGLPVYPIALFSYRTGSREPEPQGYQVGFPSRRILDFQFEAIELGRLDWKDYLTLPNPVASALMSRMNIAASERPRAKAACLRLLAGLRLDPARRRLVTGFIDTYLSLDEKECMQLMQEIELFEPGEREVVMEWTNNWVEQGRQEGRQEGLQAGRQEGLAEGLALAVRARFGPPGDSLAGRLSEASTDQLSELQKQLLNAPLDELERLL